MARRSKAKLIGFKGEQALEHALAELATDERGRSVSALLRRLAWEHVNAHRERLTLATRMDLDSARLVKTRRQYVRREDRTSA